MNTMNMSKFIGIAVVAILLMPMLALSATMKAGEEVTIVRGDDVEDNLYVAGGNVSLNSIVSGDLFTAGGNVLITENVTDDILVVGGAIAVLGDSGGDVRVAGGSMLLAGGVAGDLIAVGGTLTVSSDVIVGGDLVLATGQASVDGEVLGDVDIAAGVATINGHIQGDVIAKIDDKLTIGDSAVIDGNLAYSSRNSENLKMGEGAVVMGEIVFEEMKGGSKADTRNVLISFIGIILLFKLAAFVTVALILTWLFKNFSNSVVREVVGNPLRMLGYGFVTVIVVPAAAAILFTTLLGIPLGIIVMLSYMLLMIVSGIYTGVVAGAWLSKVMYKAQTPVVTWKNVVGGTVLVTLVTLVPIVGWTVGLFVFLVTVGSLANLLHNKLWSNR